MNNSEASRYGLPEDAINKSLLVLADFPSIERVILYGSIDLVLARQITNPVLLEHIERIGIVLFQPEPRTKSLKSTQASHRATQ